MSTLLFYSNVVPLSRERHRGLKLKPLPEDYTFAASTPLVPLAGSELFPASKHYPVLFSGADEHTVAVALLGTAEGSNLFVDAEGRWADDVYIPAFVRRYPFVLVTSANDDTLTVCIDDTWKGFSEEEGEPLFTDSGEPAEPTKRAIDFVQRYHAEMQRTQAFIARVRELDLLVRRDLQITDGDRGSLLVKDFRLIEEQRFAKLADDVIVEFHRAGWLPWVYAHLASLGNLQALHKRMRPRR